jgi:hypothetical protein
MEQMLIVVTAASLLLAMLMSVVAWKLLADGRRQSSARAAALRALALPEHRGEVETDEERSADAEAAGLAATAPVWDAPLRTDGVSPQPVAAARGVRPRWAAVAGALVLAGAATGAFVLRATASGESWPAGARSAPLELVSVRHSIGPGGTFLVTGFVQNPSGGLPVNDAVVVVYLFDLQGGYVASGRAALDTRTLVPGADASFTIEVPVATPIGRYRIGFRSSDGAVVAHVDRRV